MDVRRHSETFVVEIMWWSRVWATISGCVALSGVVQLHLNSEEKCHQGRGRRK